MTSLLLRLICESVGALQVDVARFEDEGDGVSATVAGRTLGKLTALRDALARLRADQVICWEDEVEDFLDNTRLSGRPDMVAMHASAPAIRALLAALREEG